MKISYDPEADAMYITLRKGAVDHTKEVDDTTILDFDKYNKILGVELLFVKETNPDLLKQIKVENITLA